MLPGEGRPAHPALPEGIQQRLALFPAEAHPARAVHLHHRIQTPIRRCHSRVCYDTYDPMINGGYVERLHFKSIEHAHLALRAWIHHYNNLRPHQALNFNSPTQFHQAQCTKAA